MWGVSRNELAKRLEISRSMLQKYLAAEDVNMRLDTIAHLANKLGVSVESLILGTAFSNDPLTDTTLPPRTRVVKLRRKLPRRFIRSFPLDRRDGNA